MLANTTRNQRSAVAQGGIVPAAPFKPFVLFCP